MSGPSPACRLAGPPAMRGFMARLLAPEIDAWHGRVRLGPLFWGKGVAVSLLLIALHARLIVTAGPALQQLSLCGLALYTLWILVAVWRTAGRAHPFWGSLARGLTIAWALNAGFVLLFLELDLIAGLLV